ncbi:unnamed protein product [Brachionus calyciflorus]|uniref:Uncharacterized protein n=1 Tax=Brachionus calyciflorus TaxID=104777 RepID=A0A813WKU8_9BILA|nr:unnamed protein product [Brachionus calyciflorus]
MKIQNSEILIEQVYLPKKIKRDLATVTTTQITSDLTTKISRSKQDNHETPNEFTSGYAMKPVEIVVIIFVLVLWILSLRKFYKTFDKLRTTHYIDVPYKYKIKDPHNLSHVKVVNNQTESVIYSRDPIKSLKIKLYPDEPSLLQARSSSSPSEVDRNKFKNNDFYLNRRIGSNSFSCLNMHENESIYDNRFHYDSCGNRKKNSLSNNNILGVMGYSQEEDASKFLNPLYNLSPLIKKSLLDLHKKSIENLAQTSTSINNKSLQSNTNSANTTPKSTSNKIISKLRGNSSFSNTTSNSINQNRKRDFQKEHLTVKFLESPV